MCVKIDLLVTTRCTARVGLCDLDRVYVSVHTRETRAYRPRRGPREPAGENVRITAFRTETLSPPPDPTSFRDVK